MKKSISVLVIFVTGFISCSQQKSDPLANLDDSEIIELISSSKEFNDYSEAVKVDNYKMVSYMLEGNESYVDEDKIDHLIRSNPEYRSMCVFPDELLKGVKGGKEYKEIQCNISESFEKLNDQFAFSKLHPEVIEAIRRRYDALNSDDSVQNMLNEKINTK